MQAQLQGLVHKRFLADNEYSQLAHFPRYLKAMNVRLEKLRGRSGARRAADGRVAARGQPVPAHHQEAAGQEHRSAHDGVPLDAGGVARVAVRAGAAHADAGVGKRLQKVWESMQRK
jgi:ATP-dependent helicase HrpA